MFKLYLNATSWKNFDPCYHVNINAQIVCAIT